MSASARAGARFVTALALCMTASGAAAAAPAARGHVEQATARWTADGDLIVTELVVETTDGRRVPITVPGGTVDGIGMAFSHHDSHLIPGDEVVLEAERHGVRARRVNRVAPIAALAAGTPRFGVQRTSRSGRTLYHASGCLELVYDGRGTSQHPGDAEWAAVDEALAAWERASSLQSCGGVSFQRRVMTYAPDGRDELNTLRFRDDSWCRPATLTEPMICHSPDAVGVTRVIYVDDPASPRDGEILEVDIEFNAVHFSLSTDGRAGAFDLASVAAHEIGHALGLDHNCGLEDGAWPSGPDGTPVASCESLPPELGDATMYFQIQPGTVSMRSPQASDVEGLCAVVSTHCTLDITGGCHATGDPSPAGLLVCGALAGLLARRRQSTRATVPGSAT